MKIYNTLTRKKEEFVTLEPNKVKMYVCGPTVYDYIHIGNARPYVVFDVVRRYLEYKGYEVNYVQNFTDVDDKIINRANEEKVSMGEISTRYINEALIDALGLNVKEATFNPKVTEEIEDIIKMIEKLLSKGHAYVVDGSVFFDTKSFDGYGKLSNKNIDDLEMGARVKVDESKKNPMDFVLWKPKKECEPFWKSPWGDGRPGWHIECSVMAKKYLGEKIDIHAGGEDLVFPHHENEIAQSECANGAKFVKYWLHNGFINVDNEKMSKSKGNFFTLRDIVKEVSYDVVRFFILTGHYRGPINFSKDLMQAASNSLDRIKNCVKNLIFIEENSDTKVIKDYEKDILKDYKKFRSQFETAMDDDFNTADAITAIFDFVRFINSNLNENSSVEFISTLKAELFELCDILGIIFCNEKEVDNINEIEILIEKRQKARAEKDFALSDKIRDDLAKIGIVLEDTPSGVRWSKV